MNKTTRKLGKNQSLFNCFLAIDDPRVGGRVIHPLINIITITLCALICGCDSWKAIALFGHQRRRWLGRFLDLSMGIPSHLTIARVISLIEPQAFENCLADWMKQICDFVAADVINIDGKTLRGSSHLEGGKKAEHIINAYSPKHQATLACVKTPDKSNEIKGIPILLKSLTINDMIVTIDAMGTQKGIASLIRKKKGHYVLALKKNHKRLHKKVTHLFEKADELNYQGMVYKKHSEQNSGHHRIECREYTVLPMMYLHKYKYHWQDLQSFIRVKSIRYFNDGRVEEASRFYISSMPLKHYQRTCFAIRDHWQIENGLHYRLDVGLLEDRCPIYRGYAARNLGLMRKLVLKLLSDESTHDEGIAMKRLRAALDTRYLTKVVGF